jgi:LacI family transcriptional regulator
VETSLASGREILLGISRFVSGHDHWMLYHEARGLEDELPHWLRKWDGDGIIARVQTKAMAAFSTGPC